MKVTLVNHSDSLGGASVVTYRLMEALRRAGVDARMLVLKSTTGNRAVRTVGTPLQRKAAFLAEHLEIFMRNGFSRADLFKASIATVGVDFLGHPWIADADAVLLNWVNQGMMSLAQIERLAQIKPVVWTMHDMWNCTGICHHAYNCRRYEADCGCCPLVHLPPHAADLSRSAWRRKKHLYSSVPIRFVAVSNWLADKCRASSLLANADVRVIPVAFDLSDTPVEPSMSRPDLGLGIGEEPIVLMGAARLDDPVKGLPVAIEALNQVQSSAIPVFFGALRNPDILSALKRPYLWLGPVSDPLRLRQIFAHASVVISSSCYESLGATLIEGQAAGCTPVSFGNGGQPDIIDHGRTGYIARWLDAANLARYIDKALRNPFSPAVLREAVQQRFGAENVAKQYIELINSIK